MPAAASRYKRPESVLVVVHTDRAALLLQRADHPAFWQSVTGSLEWHEADARAAAVRELEEETGLRVEPDRLCDLGLVRRYSILPRWRARYAPDVTENTERAFALALEREVPIHLSHEHTAFSWLPFAAAAARATSWTNRAAIVAVAGRMNPGTGVDG